MKLGMWMPAMLVVVLGACSSGGVPVEYPTAQKEFFRLNVECKSAYEKGINEIQQSLAFNECNRRRSEFARTSQPTSWVGTITDLSTDQGADVVSLDITAELDGFSVKFRTVSNRVSDEGSDSLITPRNPLFNVLANMRVGQQVAFSGTFLRDPAGERGIWEASLSERGSVEEPEFNLRFSSIVPLVQGQVAGAEKASVTQVSQPADERHGMRMSDTASGVDARGEPELQHESEPSAQMGDSALQRADEATQIPPGQSSYREVKAQLQSAGYGPLPIGTEVYRMTVDGDPAACGNAGCSIPWQRADSAVCVGVTVNDNVEEPEWEARIVDGVCD